MRKWHLKSPAADDARRALGDSAAMHEVALPTVLFAVLAVAGIVFWCAGNLAGRAASIGVRSRSTPHDDMRPDSL
jgi:hypothetical protein